jgi:hypothetical protein
MSGTDDLVGVGALQVTSNSEIDEAKEQEIFEFPWVVFEVASKQVVDEKTVYVKPTIHEDAGMECVKAALGDEASAAMKSAGTLQSAVQVTALKPCWVPVVHGAACGLGAISCLLTLLCLCRSSMITRTALSL